MRPRPERKRSEDFTICNKNQRLLGAHWLFYALISNWKWAPDSHPHVPLPHTSAPVTKPGVRPWLIALLVLITLSAGGLLFWRQRSHAERQALLDSQTAPVVRDTLVVKVSASGSIRPLTPVNISPKLQTEDFTKDPKLSHSVGLYKVMGTTVEAVVGGIYHQYVCCHTLSFQRS